ncbi:Na(+)/H(+) antiporter subunit D [Peptococcaceae bacterium]|nr:Na(+)/H(+) antiporter subunit D [Peptococcaceae bacterium]
MFELNLHPSLFLLVGALLVLILPVNLRFIGLIGGPLLSIVASLSIPTGTVFDYHFLGLELQVLKVDALSKVFGVIFSIIAFIAAVYALHVRNKGEHIAGLLYAAGSLGVVFAGDWLTLFFCWEVMAAASVFLIWYRKTRKALGAGFRYVLVHFIGGNILLAGILLLALQGDIAITPLSEVDGWAFWLILLGVGINAAIIPLHFWLTDAYPEGTITGSVFLCAFTTKVAVYVLIRVFPGTELLIWLGVAMVLYGIVYAILENDARRLLAYHIVSQVGYMVAAVGIGTKLALNGGVAHAYSHILYKALLFMGAGAVIYATGKSKLTELGGLTKAIPLVAILYMIGGVSISGFPLFNGFISKSIIVYSASDMQLVWILLHLASVGTFLSTTLKLPYAMFIGGKNARVYKKSDLKKIPINMYIAMFIGAFLCMLYGVYPNLLYNMLPYPLEYEPYEPLKVIATIQLLTATAIAFWIYMSKVGGEPKPKITLDIADWFFKKPGAICFNYLLSFIAGIKGVVDRGIDAFLKAMKPYLFNPRLIVIVPLCKVSSSYASYFEQKGWITKEIYCEFDEDRYRTSIGASVLITTVVLIFTAVAILII